MQLNRRKFFKYTGLLSGLAVLNPLRFLGLFKPESALSMETMKAAFDQSFVSCEGPESSTYFLANANRKARLYLPTPDNPASEMSYWNGKQWIPMED